MIKKIINVFSPKNKSVEIAISSERSTKLGLKYMHMPLEYTFALRDSQWLNKKKQEKIESLNLVQTSRFLMSQNPKTQRWNHVSTLLAFSLFYWPSLV